MATSSGTLVATFGYFWPPPVPAEETLVAAFAPSITVQFHLSSPNLSAADDPCGNFHLFLPVSDIFALFLIEQLALSSSQFYGLWSEIFLVTATVERVIIYLRG